ncbi:MAG: chlorite dismutase family protein [Euryarchaeota archaeon]|nr:chlorite dismutase family protein [Euryarchaeota archaeon]MDE1835192.1 chlorite dismutase family protein [Euryarchaeota archaeon]MDE1880050.1 chlorite dismutase family protein [Euryarchaeota archaeon]MDE2045734.1 chlorite dismutase family protein [Thermoplasmata archaeon]
MTSVDAEGASRAAAGETEVRDFVRYTFLRMGPAWRQRSRQERLAGIDELQEVLQAPPAGLMLRTFSLVGTKAGVDAMLWTVSPRLESLQELEARIGGTRMGAVLDVPFAYLGMGRRSEYLGGHDHGGQEGGRVSMGTKPYLFVYPFVKKRAWYGLPFKERQRIMGEHFRIGHQFPEVEIHTGYSFGLDDPEFILSFGADDPATFLDLVQALRPSEASRYTEIETPIFTCVACPPRRMLELGSGIVP